MANTHRRRESSVPVEGLDVPGLPESASFQGASSLDPDRATPGGPLPPRPSLGRRLILAGTALLTITAALVAALGARTTAAFLTARYREHLQGLAEYAAMHVELGILLQDSQMVRNAVASLPDRPDLVGITVIDNDGRLLYTHMRASSGRREPPHWVEAPVWTREVQEAGPGLEAGTAVRRVGTVRLGYSLHVLRHLLWKLGLRFALITGAVILVSVGVYGWIARSLTRPLRRLEAVAQEVAQGRLERRAPVGGFRETDQVAFMFNAMLDALVRREKDLEQLNAKLARREALAEVGRFSSMVAHEIKNPLTILRGSLQALRRPDPSRTAHATALRFMEEEIARIDRLVGDFLLFAKPIVAHKQVGDWNRWLDRAAEKMRLMADGAERLEVRPLPQQPALGRFDPALMETALGHLVRNALDADPQGTVRLEAWVEVGALARAQEGVMVGVKEEAKPAVGRETGAAGWWCVAVEDDGPGIPEEHRAKVFEPFFTTKAKGSGLGLAMVRRIVESHGGSVDWEPGAAGKGSRFVVRMPVMGVRGAEEDRG